MTKINAFILENIVHILEKSNNLTLSPDNSRKIIAKKILIFLNNNCKISLRSKKIEN